MPEALNTLGRPLYLAGGLNTGNVAEAVTAVPPWGLDLCSSVRSAGRLDAVRLAAFFTALRGADAAARRALLAERWEGGGGSR